MQNSGIGQQAASANNGAEPSATTTLRVTTRMVTVDVVAKDHRGKPIPDLTAKDFHVYEQVASK